MLVNYQDCTEMHVSKTQKKLITPLCAVSCRVVSGERRGKRSQVG